MANLSTQTIPVDEGVIDIAGALTAAASGGDTAEVGEGIFLLAINGHASETRTITIATPGTFHGLAIPDVALAVLTLDTAILPLSGAAFRGANGRAAITYSDSAADITIGIFKLGK